MLKLLILVAFFKLSTNSLLLIHTIFRHGNRTPNGPDELYPTDPYLNESYYPTGLGQLTIAGKIKAYNLGKLLRQRYNYFLDDKYSPEILEAQTTDYNRTKMSLELVLAALFPPKGEYNWNNDPHWQPIPYKYQSRTRDNLLMGILCENYTKLLEEHRNSIKEHNNKFSNYRHIFDYISGNSGLNVTNFSQIYNLYFGLTTEYEWGLKLPNWTNSVFPDLITKLAIQNYYSLVSTTQLRKIAVGYLLQKIIQDTKRKIKGNQRKIYLYSAHENNIAQLLIVLGLFDSPHIPPYGAFLSFELHQIQEKHGFKIYYENYSTSKPVLMKLPACEEFCELNQFISLINEYFPEENLCKY